MSEVLFIDGQDLRKRRFARLNIVLDEFPSQDDRPALLRYFLAILRFGVVTDATKAAIDLTGMALYRISLKDGTALLHSNHEQIEDGDCFLISNDINKVVSVSS